MDDLNQEQTEKTKLFRSNPILNIFFILAFSGVFIYYMVSAPVTSQSVANRQGTLIHVSSNQTLSSIAKELEEKNVVRQAGVLKIFVKLFRFGHPVVKGDYLFKERIPVWRVAWMLARGKHGIDPLRITIKEGSTNKEITDLLSKNMQAFRIDLFESDERNKQGYLFPDTYFFFPMTTAKEILDDISSNFDRKITPFKIDIEKSNRSLGDIIIMASIIEKEAAGDSDASTISGILWKRIEKGTPLQVDASKITYKEVGLPKEPIGNPGLLSIKAAIYPQKSDYLYYLHEKSGLVHYAKTFEEHKNNINKYLK